MVKNYTTLKNKYPKRTSKVKDAERAFTVQKSTINNILAYSKTLVVYKTSSNQEIELLLN